MLNEMMGKLVEEFDERQNALIAAVGGKLKAILRGMKTVGALNHGNPPFIVDDGEISLLLVDKDGEYAKLPPSFSTSEETTVEGFDAIYSLPILSFGLIRFIPTRADFVGPEIYRSGYVASAYSPPFLRGMEQYLDAMSNTVPELAALRMAKKLIKLQPAMEAGAKEAGVGLESYMQLREVRDAFISVLGDSLVEGARRASEMVQEVRAQQA